MVVVLEGDPGDAAERLLRQAEEDLVLGPLAVDLRAIPCRSKACPRVIAGAVIAVSFAAAPSPFPGFWFLRGW